MALDLGGLDKLQPAIDKIARLPSKYRLAIVIALPLLLMGGYYQLMYTGAAETVKQLEGQQQSKQRKLNEVRSVAANLDQFEEEIDGLQAELTIALRQLPDSKELPGLLTDVTTLGKKSGLEFKAFRPGSEINRGFYAEVPIEIEFTGNYHEVGMFFDRVSKLDRIVNIGDIRMGVAKEGLNGTILKVRGQALTFRFVEGGGA
jgi:type IV pilus assembly protein PilO